MGVEVKLKQGDISNEVDANLIVFFGHHGMALQNVKLLDEDGSNVIDRMQEGIDNFSSYGFSKYFAWIDQDFMADDELQSCMKSILEKAKLLDCKIIALNGVRDPKQQNMDEASRVKNQDKRVKFLYDYFREHQWNYGVTKITLISMGDYFIRNRIPLIRKTEVLYEQGNILDQKNAELLVLICRRGLLHASGIKEIAGCDYNSVSSGIDSILKLPDGRLFAWMDESYMSDVELENLMTDILKLAKKNEIGVIAFNGVKNISEQGLSEEGKLENQKERVKRISDFFLNHQNNHGVETTILVSIEDSFRRDWITSVEFY